MMIWLVFAAMTGLAAFAVLSPLSRHAGAAGFQSSDRAFYNAQLLQIDKDITLGLLTHPQAAALRTEAGRSVLRASKAEQEVFSHSKTALYRRRIASVLVLCGLPLVTLGLYGVTGSPQQPAQPYASRSVPNPEGIGLDEAIARVEAQLAKSSEDGRGWDVIAPVYLKSGRLEDAVKAYETALRLNGETTQRLSAYGEAVTVSQDGLVSATARSAFERALVLDGQDAKARYYLAVAAEQDGNKQEARKRLTELLQSASPDAPWTTVVRARLTELEASPISDAIASLSPSEQRTAIEGMVASLAQRLEAQPQDVDGWLRLIRSYTVLNDPDRAHAALLQAKTALALDPAALQRLNEVSLSLDAGLQGLSQ